MEINYKNFECLTSTNEWARQHIDTFEKGHLTVISAHQQTQGRGQWGKGWFSPKNKNIYATFVFFSMREAESLTYTHLLALASVELLEQYKVTAAIVWPNDLWVMGKKIGGILCERVEEWVVLGIGLNINSSPEELITVGQPATSLLIETQSQLHTESLLTALAENFHDKLLLFQERGWSPFQLQLASRLVHKLL